MYAVCLLFFNAYLGDPDVGELLPGVVEVTLHVLADDGLLVVAAHVVPLDAVAVEVVQHRHARLTALAVVGLALAGTEIKDRFMINLQFSHFRRLKR